MTFLQNYHKISSRNTVKVSDVTAIPFRLFSKLMRMPGNLNMSAVTPMNKLLSRFIQRNPETINCSPNNVFRRRSSLNSNNRGGKFFFFPKQPEKFRNCFRVQKVNVPPEGQKENCGKTRMHWPRSGLPYLPTM